MLLENFLRYKHSTLAVVVEQKPIWWNGLLLCGQINQQFILARYAKRNTVDSVSIESYIKERIWNTSL